MRNPPRLPRILPALLLALVLPAAPRAEQETPKAKVQRLPSTPEMTAPKSQTQTAPSPRGGQGKPQTHPGEAGFRDIQGTVIQVFPERHAIVVRTTANDHQVFVTPQTVLLRDGHAVDVKQIVPGDRVESCQFNAKNVIRKMTVLGTGKPLIRPSDTPPSKP